MLSSTQFPFSSGVPIEVKTEILSNLVKEESDASLNQELVHSSSKCESSKPKTLHSSSDKVASSSSEHKNTLKHLSSDVKSLKIKRLVLS